jgi:sporulation related protein
MRSASGDSSTVLPWLLIRQDGHGNRYRVGSYATRDEAQAAADRLARDDGGGGQSGGAGRAEGYLVVPRDR